MTSPALSRTRQRYYNPVSKIQSIIQNLDAELEQLCKQCSIPRPFANQYLPGGQSSLTGRNISAGSSRVNALSGSTVDNRAGTRSTTTMNKYLEVAASEKVKRQLRNAYRTRVVDAYRNRRIFTVFGNFRTVRNALKQRGWLEKLPPNRFAQLQNLSEDTLLEQARNGNDYEAVVISKLINNFPAFFIWQSKVQNDMCGDVLPYRNRVRRTAGFDFSTKVGLVGCSEQERWFREEGICGMSYPRFYRLGNDNAEERASFIDDFNNTQARSLLRFIKEQDVTSLVDPENGTKKTTVLDYALQKLKNEIREKEHLGLDDVQSKQRSPAEVAKMEAFMDDSKDILKDNARFRASKEAIIEYARLADKYLKEIEKLRPDFRWDGCRNLWILKPGFQSRGIGIVIRNSLDDILTWTTSNPGRKYIVQKYIERPLLIYKTKFDVRQYMLLTVSDSKVKVWMYRDCYLRFSTQEFTMDDLRESIHLTNNSVQKRYRNNETRDARLPRHNMWNLNQFTTYLRQVNAPENTWDLIFNGFKENVVAVVMASIDETELKPNAFELYGCDFMIDEHYNPILIEINSSPDLTPSTEVTARICPMALKDLIRVVVDLPKNPHAPTGLFECVYELNYRTYRRAYDDDPLIVDGSAAVLHEAIQKATPLKHKFLRRIVRTVKDSKPNRKDNAKDHLKRPSTKTNSSSTLKDKVIVKKTLKERLKLKNIHLLKEKSKSDPAEISSRSTEKQPQLKIKSTAKKA